MGQYNKTSLAAVLVALLFLGAQACSSSNFAGGAGGTAGLTGKGGKGGKDSSNDGEDGADGPGADSNDGPEGGGGKDSGGEDGPDGGLAGSDNNGGDDSPDGDDDEISAKTHHDMDITRGEAETPTEIKIELVKKGKTVKTETVLFGEKETEAKKAKLMCRNSKDTCVKITFTNKDDNDENGHIEVVGGNPTASVSCSWAQETGNSALVDVDMDGDEQSGIFDQGTCKAEDKDDQFTFTCPQSKKLQVQLCTGG